MFDQRLMRFWEIALYVAAATETVFKVLEWSGNAVTANALLATVCFGLGQLFGIVRRFLRAAGHRRP